MARVVAMVHGLPKVLPMPAMLYPFNTLEGWAQGGHKAGGLRPSSTPLDTPRLKPLSRDSRLSPFLPAQRKASATVRQTIFRNNITN
jgi:hypothetical protein